MCSCQGPRYVVRNQDKGERASSPLLDSPDLVVVRSVFCAEQGQPFPSEEEIAKEAE